MIENYSPVIYTSTNAGDLVSAALQIFSLLYTPGRGKIVPRNII